MKYELYDGDAKSDGEVRSADLADNFVAETWAKDWVRANATSDFYTLERADGGLSMAVYRTTAGQWYLTPKLR